MKKICALILFCLPILAFSQNQGNQINVNLLVQNKLKKVVPFTDLWLLEKETGEKLLSTTDSLGLVDFNLDPGKTYSVNFEDVTNASSFIAPLLNTTLFKQTVIYNGKNAGKKLSEINPDTIFQNIPVGQKASRTETVRIFQTVNNELLFLPNLTVRIFSKSKNKVYVAKSNDKATVRFFVPPGKYLISIENLINYQEFEVKYETSLFITDFLYYEPGDVKEFDVNDTITQKLSRNADATSEKSLLRITLRNPEFKALPDEPIWVNVQGSNKVYYGVTDDQGRVKLLLKKGQKYVVHLKYERDISEINFEMVGDLYTTNLNIEYLGSKHIEDYWANSKRGKEGFMKEFPSRSIKDAEWDQSVYERTAYGFNLNFKFNTENYSPAIIDDKMVVSSGYFTPNIYCINSKTGQFNWGVKLAENGPSPTVCQDGILLINTESCTLYAIEASSGKLLWSKWLGPFLYSTPSVSNGKVFAVYPSSLYTYDEISRQSHQFVAIAFDLKTGEIVWQSWMDSEVLASPVVANGKVYMTSLRGTLYQFDEEKGTLLNAAKLNAVSPPTVIDDFAYVSVASENRKQKIVQLKTSDLSIVKKFNNLTGNLYFNTTTPHSFGPFELMGFTGAQTSVYQDKNYTILGGKLICYKPNDGTIIWSNILEADQVYKSQGGSTPIFLKDKLILNTRKGKIKVLDPSNGKLIKEFNTNAELVSEPTIYDGWIYTGSKTGKVISINTKDKTFTDNWGQWNGNGTHNRVVK